ncbi:MAG: bifunctional UDP-N-acetylglucosamine diphosphorylase/glucosamine-1-phosphate N-acetyltransferase GlmU [Alphaproteobacteria bacterium]|nr:bifunctional UDP-N-acetylglucosamine diphosphorylase/glucosamine-1-phosphate N-acetyltransferase GlmU [Alphaproteobacteria bacterium]
MSSSTPLAAIILAAGQGTRMQSSLPKVLHPVAGRSMLGHVLALSQALNADRRVVVVAPDMPMVTEAARSQAPDVRIAVQTRQLGTADAVKAAAADLTGFAGDVLILYADTPLVQANTLQAMLTARRKGASVMVLGFRPADPSPYGRLMLDDTGALEAIVESRDCNPEQRAVTLCNSGVMAVDGAVLFSLLQEVGNTNSRGEYYLTDIIAIARKRGLACAVIEADADEVLGVNSRIELSQAEAILQNRLRRIAMLNGATLLDPSTVYFSHDTQLGRDVVVGQNVVFGPGVRVADGVQIKPFSHLEGASVAAAAEIGPYGRLRPGADIGRNAKIGNFVEVKAARIEEGAKISHLSYIGDARVGAGANVGAGTITCNYDGFEKHFTDIGAGAFIGSNTCLVAPVKIGDGAYTGSGSVITRDVSSDALALVRPQQIEKTGWAARFRARFSGKKSGHG